MPRVLSVVSPFLVPALSTKLPSQAYSVPRFYLKEVPSDIWCPRLKFYMAKEFVMRMVSLFIAKAVEASDPLLILPLE